MTQRVHTVKTKRIRRPGVGGWVSMAQLAREIDVAYNRWLQRRQGDSVVIVKRRTGRPRNPMVTAALAEWRALGRPKQGFAEICRRFGVNYGSAMMRRNKEEKQRRAAA